MDTVRFAFTVIEGIFVLLFVAKAIDWLLKRGTLGTVLWTRSADQRWMVLVFMLLSVLDVADGIYSREYHRLISGAFFALLAFFLSFPPGRLRVYEKGIETGWLVLPWEKISGWEWGPKSGSRGRPASLGTEGPGERQLYLWTPSLWRLFYDPRPARPVKTEVPFDNRLDNLMAAKAPRRPPSTEAPEHH